MIFLGVSILLGFLTVLIGTPYAKRYLLASGIYGVDQQKHDKPKLPTSGGLPVLFGFVVAVTSYLGFVALFGVADAEVSLILAALSSVSIIALIGFIDDIHINIEEYVREELDLEEGEFKFEIEGVKARNPTDVIWERVTRWAGGEEVEREEIHRKGVSQMPKMLFVLPAAFPMIAVGAGSWTMHFPVVGAVEWGLFYPLVLLPLGLLFVSNVVNMLAGTNGLAPGMAMVAGAGLGTFALMNGRIAAALIGFGLSASLLGFMFYNFYPASILPGDSLTYLAGAALFSAIVIGNMEKFAVFIFAPWFVEFFLKLRSGFKAHSWGDLQPDGTLKPKYDKNYSLTHPLMRRGFNEKQVTLALVGLETLICVAGIILFTAVPWL